MNNIVKETAPTIFNTGFICASTYLLNIIDPKATALFLTSMKVFSIFKNKILTHIKNLHIPFQINNSDKINQLINVLSSSGVIVSSLYLTMKVMLVSISALQIISLFTLESIASTIFDTIK
jgi:type III secretory pathway component EscU